MLSCVELTGNVEYTTNSWINKSILFFSLYYSHSYEMSWPLQQFYDYRSLRGSRMMFWPKMSVMLLSWKEWFPWNYSKWSIRDVLRLLWAYPAIPIDLGPSLGFPVSNFSSRRCYRNFANNSCWLTDGQWAILCH